MLTQTARVLSRSWVGTKAASFADDGESTSRTEVTIDREAYDDMGQPETITVTVRPGDHLN